MDLMDRRRLIEGLGWSALAASASPTLARAQPPSRGAPPPPSAPWSLGFADLYADVQPQPMTLMAGRSPAGLKGTLYRNGPARFRRKAGAASHWFDGDGLIRAFSIEDGQATLGARFIDTPKRRRDAAADAVISPGFGTPAGAGVSLASSDDTNAANISVIPMAGELWALWEAGSPTRIDPKSLATLGVETFRADLAHMPFLAHPRREPGGDLWNLGINGAKAIVWRVDQQGQLVNAEVIELPVASYVHDFTATERHLVVILQPLVQDEDRLPFIDGFVWRPSEPTRIMVLDKSDLSSRRLYELPAFFAFHYGAAWEQDNGAILFDVCAADTPDFALSGARRVLHGQWTEESPPTLRLVTLPLSGPASITAGTLQAEFPRNDDRFSGRRRERTIHAAGPRNGPLFAGLSVHSWRSGGSDSFDFGPDYLVEEAVFTPREGGEQELDGWLLAPALNLRAQASELHVFSARHVADGPVASWRADVALPVSLHGAFVAA